MTEKKFDYLTARQVIENEANERRNAAIADLQAAIKDIEARHNVRIGARAFVTDDGRLAADLAVAALPAG